MIKKVFITPLQKFAKIEGFSGILLLLSTIVALIWANSAFSESYESIWQYKIGFTGDNFELKKPLILWINDGLMAIFFFLIGLEIKREILIGELNSPKKLAFPLFGAFGGVALPILIYVLLNNNPETAHGWGIPMATDIAFSLAVLNTLGKRVPLSLKVFLIAFAIVDDIQAVLVIALFYSGSLHLSLLAIAMVLLGFLYFLTYKGYYSTVVLVFVGAVIWLLFLKSGVHPTVAGIMLALCVPIRQKIDATTFITKLESVFTNIKAADDLKEPILSKDQETQMSDLQNWSGKFQSPLQHLEHLLHGWVAFFIIPVFALANAGVAIDSTVNVDYDLVIHIILALVLGKGFGIPIIVYLAAKLNLVQIPSDITVRHIFGVSFIAGIGFTMAIFIASLAFEAHADVYTGSAKIGILIGSFVSAIIGYSILRFGTKAPE